MVYTESWKAPSSISYLAESGVFWVELTISPLSSGSQAPFRACASVSRPVAGLCCANTMEVVIDRDAFLKGLQMVQNTNAIAVATRAATTIAATIGLMTTSFVKSSELTAVMPRIATDAARRRGRLPRRQLTTSRRRRPQRLLA